MLSRRVRSKTVKVPKGNRGEKLSKDMATSKNLVLTIGAQASPKMEGRNQVSGRVSGPCWHARPVAKAPWKQTTNNSVKVKFGIKLIKLVENLIGWEVTIGQGSECHLTFVRARIYIDE